MERIPAPLLVCGRRELPPWADFEVWRFEPASSHRLERPRSNVCVGSLTGKCHALVFPKGPEEDEENPTMFSVGAGCRPKTDTWAAAVPGIGRYEHRL